MQTTLEIPDSLLRRAEIVAAERGIQVPELVAEALAEKLQHTAQREKPWMKCFGALADLKGETARINAIIEDEFERLEPEDLE